MSSKNQEFQEIKVIGVDIEQISLSKAKGYYRLPLKLSTYPEPQWAEWFKDIYEKKAANLYRAMWTSGNCIWLMLALKDDQQRHVHIIKESIMETNSEYREFRMTVVNLSDADEQRSRENEELLRRLRDEADKLQF